MLIKSGAALEPPKKKWTASFRFRTAFDRFSFQLNIIINNNNNN